MPNPAFLIDLKKHTIAPCPYWPPAVPTKMYGAGPGFVYRACRHPNGPRAATPRCRRPPCALNSCAIVLRAPGSRARTRGPTYILCQGALHVIRRVYVHVTCVSAYVYAYMRMGMHTKGIYMCRICVWKGINMCICMCICVWQCIYDMRYTLYVVYTYM